ncbi:MAG TPA: thioesterase family protein [Thermoanaerobaculia bacterium]|jgi:4-hydroxybenzoyl-CoA thioesterase/acyl-CoA thioester hydrolase|nr:thioesterase family protein [Thermoanaerobaculia bacterium]
MHEFHARRRIEFSDTDMGGIVHFARFFVFMEWAEHEFLRSLGADPGSFQDAEGRRIAWPRVAATCEYLSPARFGDDLDIYLRVLRKGRTSLSYGFEIRIGDRPVARGKVSVVYCQIGEEGLKPLPIPEAVAALIDEAPTARS